PPLYWPLLCSGPAASHLRTAGVFDLHPTVAGQHRPPSVGFTEPLVCVRVVRSRHLRFDPPRSCREYVHCLAAALRLIMTKVAAREKPAGCLAPRFISEGVSHADTGMR